LPPLSFVQVIEEIAKADASVVLEPNFGMLDGGGVSATAAGRGSWPGGLDPARQGSSMADIG
jgi:hypothetical protein